MVFFDFFFSASSFSFSISFTCNSISLALNIWKEKIFKSKFQLQQQFLTIMPMNPIIFYNFIFYSFISYNFKYMMKYFRSSLIITIMDKIRTLQHFHYHCAKIKSQEMQYWVPYLIYGYNSEHIWMQSLFYSWKNNWLLNSHPIPMWFSWGFVYFISSWTSQRGRKMMIFIVLCL